MWHRIPAQQKALTLADIDFIELHYWFETQNNLSYALIELQCMTWSTVILIIKRFRRFFKLDRLAVFLKPKYPTDSITRMNGRFRSHQPTSGLLLWGLTEGNSGISSLFSFCYGLTVFITNFLSSRIFSFLYYFHGLGCRNKIPPQQQALTLADIDFIELHYRFDT